MSLTASLKNKKIDVVESIGKILPLFRKSLCGRSNNNNTIGETDGVEEDGCLSSSSPVCATQLALAYREAYLLCNSKIIDLASNNKNFELQQQQMHNMKTKSDSNNSNENDDDDDHDQITKKDVATSEQQTKHPFYFYPEFIQKTFPNGVPASSSSAPGALLLQHVIGAELAEFFISGFGEEFSALLASHQQNLQRFQQQSQNLEMKNELIASSCVSLLELYNSHFDKLMDQSLPLLESFLPPTGWYTSENALLAIEKNNNNNNHSSSSSLFFQHQQESNNSNNNHCYQQQAQPYHHLFNNSNSNSTTNQEYSASSSSSPFTTNISSHNIKHLYHAASTYGAAIHQPISLREVIFRHWCDFALTPHVGTLMNAAATLLFLAPTSNENEDAFYVSPSLKLVSKFVSNLKEISGCETRSTNPNTQSMFFLSAIVPSSSSSTNSSASSTFQQARTKILSSLSNNLNTAPTTSSTNNNNNNNTPPSSSAQQQQNPNREKTYYDSFKQIAHEVLHQKIIPWITDWSIHFYEEQKNMVVQQQQYSSASNSPFVAYSSTTSAAAAMNNNNTPPPPSNTQQELIHALVSEINDYALRRHFIVIRDRAKLVEFRRELVILLEKHCAPLVSSLYSSALNNLHHHQTMMNRENQQQATKSFMKNLFELSLLSTQLMKHLHVNLTSVAHLRASQVLAQTIKKSLFITTQQQLKEDDESSSSSSSSSLNLGIEFVSKFTEQVADLEFLCSSSIPSDGSSLLAIDCGFSNAMLSMNYDFSSNNNCISNDEKNNNTMIAATTTSNNNNNKNALALLNPLLHEDDDNNVSGQNNNNIKNEAEEEEERQEFEEMIRTRNRHFIASLLSFVASELVSSSSSSSSSNNIQKDLASSLKNKKEEMMKTMMMMSTNNRMKSDDDNNQQFGGDEDYYYYDLACKSIALVYRYLPDKDIFATEFSASLSLKSCSCSSNNTNEFLKKSKILLEAIIEADPFASRDLKHRFDQIEQARSVGEKINLNHDINNSKNKKTKNTTDEQDDEEENLLPTSTTTAASSIEYTFNNFLPHHIALSFPKSFAQFWSKLSSPSQQQPTTISIPKEILSYQQEQISNSTLLHPKWKLSWNYGVSSCELKATYFSSKNNNTNNSNSNTEATIRCTGVQAALLIHLASTPNQMMMKISMNDEIYKQDVKPLQDANLVFVSSSCSKSTHQNKNKKKKKKKNKKNQEEYEIKLNCNFTTPKSTTATNNSVGGVLVDTYNPTLQVYESQNSLALQMLKFNNNNKKNNDLSLYSNWRRNIQNNNIIHRARQQNSSSSSTNMFGDDTDEEDDDEDDEDDDEDETNQDSATTVSPKKNHHHSSINKSKASAFSSSSASLVNQLHPSLVQSRHLSLQAAMMQILKGVDKKATTKNKEEEEGLSFKEISDAVTIAASSPHGDNNTSSSTSSSRTTTKTTPLGYMPTLIDIRTQLEALIQKSYVKKIISGEVVRYAFEA